ncbi:hypothetical protein [Rhodovulum sp. ES.010]|uniref:hypothetical protein n=1 Tax=Rhodovulum sp. ES.010 TaxID=1882821 RepID=UPI001C37C5DB|nr:hypothetical protein [Rhodovulum sp. ES.010]
MAKATGKPRQTDLKRAVSTAYYAVFHAMCRNTADMLIGSTKSARSQPAWLQAYRAIDHGQAKNQCKNGTIKRFPKDVEDFAALFIEAQDARHRADYDPGSRFTRSEVLVLIKRVEEAISAFQRVPKSDRRAFAAFVVLKFR